MDYDNEKVRNTAKMREVLEEIANMPQCEDCAGKEAPNCDSCCKETIFSPYVKSARAALAAPPEPVGNAAAMRETLVKLREDLWEMMGATSESFQERKACDMAQRIRAALAAPARNCDSYDVEDGATACMQAIDAAWHEIDTIRATICWMLALAKGGAK